ncbi:putative F-box/LRR-repeat protein At3g18150 isoform X2 [Euphorbia lathyris]|uniref:putative F-box/LRR-repeat protein At3g18150 isoform X2 n=1 Tax=Euphorbia lathyris TaxID=212925 RepID=UPI003313F1B6
MGSKRLKMEEEKQDRISDLPDSLIQHILSFLPSTKQAIQTGVLSKRWQKQWTEVPVLIFNSDGLIKDILQQLQHVKELKFGSLFISILPNMKVGDGFSPLLNIKYLTLDSPHLVKHHSGISYVLRISHVLEKLIINVPPYCKANPKGGNNYWLRDATVFDCLESHLKTIKIVGFDFPEGDARRQHMLYLVQFLLKNARVLEKMVVIVKDDGTGFPLEVSHELLSLPRCSQNAIIEFVCSKEIGNFL